MNRTLRDYFRCPDQFADFELTGRLSPEAGFFRFGDIALCFGQYFGGATSAQVSDHLTDATEGTVVRDGHIQLPFDFSQVVENLRRELYELKPRHLLGTIAEGEFSRKLYYAVRPILPVRVRKHLQRTRLKGWEEILFPKWPVDFSIESLMERAIGLVVKSCGIERVPFIWFWPDGAPGCAMMTHDVEDQEGYSFCGTLMDINDSFGIKSSFQVIPEGRYVVEQGFLENMRRRGFEVNVHDLNHDGILFQEKQEFLRRAKKINAYGRKFGAQGFRSGAMYRNQEWFEALDFSYDMSVPNVAHLEPQRGGCCTVMPYFIGDILELPLTTIQDYSLFHILGDYSIDLWNKQIDLILRRNGLISFIAHPDYLVEPRARSAYQELLGHLAQLRAERKVWVALPGEVNRWWRSRNAMKLVRDGEGWRIEGEGRERARIAYARLDADKVTYSLEEPS